MKSSLTVNNDYMMSSNRNVALESSKEMLLSFVVVVFMIQAFLDTIVDIMGLKIIFMVIKIIAVSIALFVFCTSANKTTRATKKLEFAWLFFAFAVLLDRNMDLLSGYWHTAFSYIAALVLVFILSYSTNWTKTFFDILKIFSLIHAGATMIFFLFPTVYSFYRPMIYSATGSLTLNGYKSGLTVHYSTNAIFLSQGLIAYCVEMITSKKVSLKAMFFFIILLVALFLTTKRAHILFGLGAMCYVYYVQTGRFLRIVKFTAIAAAVLLLLLWLVQYIPVIDDTIQRFINGNIKDMSGRQYIYDVAYQEFLRNPIFGRGWNWFVHSDSSKYLVKTRNWSSVGETVQVHNVYLQLLLEVGIVGFVFVVMLFIKTFLASKDLYNKLCRDNDVLFQDEKKVLLFSIGYQVFFLCYSMTGNPLYDYVVYIVYFFCCATAIAFRRKYGTWLAKRSLKRRINNINEFSEVR